jgi:patatin-related protein
VSEAPTATKELRLGLVLYGGVSLAIYMHGITKELHKLVAASRALDVDPLENPFDERTTEHVYFEVLKEEADAHGVRTRVVVDVIAGTSAGGINGVYLAKALAQNLRQDQLKKLWIDNGDIAKLLRGSSRLPLKPRLAKLLLGSLHHRRRNEPVLRGDVMSRWFVTALAEMDGTPYVEGVDTLMPEAHELELFVTATDYYGYERKIPIKSPPIVTDLRHRHVFEFRRAGQVNQFTGDYNYGLAFASRATSSFPGAFPAVSFADFERYFDPPISLGDFDEEFCRIYKLSGTSATYTFFIDGGVLNNFPFDRAIAAIRARRADVEVDRRLVYVQPDPKAPKDEAKQEPEPGWVATLWGGFAAIPAREPILDDLLEVLKRNERVQTIREIIESSFGDVRKRLERPQDVGDLEALVQHADAARLVEVRGAATEAANADVGHGYGTYVRMKIRSVVDDFAALVNNVCKYPDDSDHAFFVRAVVNAWATGNGLFAQNDKETSDRQTRFLKQFDLEYTKRQLRFLIAAASWWYRDLSAGAKPTPTPAEREAAENAPTRDQLRAMKSLLYDQLERIESITAGDALPPALRDRLKSTFDEPAIGEAIEEEGLEVTEFLKARKTDLEGIRGDLASFLDEKLSTFTTDLAEALRTQTSEWVPTARTAFFVRYLGFPFWDVLLFPVQHLSDAGERDRVEVVRISPLDTELLKVPGGGAKLKGAGIRHFAAFFEQDFRENDYLWGRLDGAERLLTLLLEPAAGTSGARWADAFHAILAEEESDLPTTADLMADVRNQIRLLRKPLTGDFATTN